MATLYKHKEESGKFYMASRYDNELTFELMYERSKEFNLPPQSVFEEGCEFLSEEEANDLLEKVDGGYYLVDYPSGEGGSCVRWVKEKFVKDLMLKEFKACSSFGQLKRVFKKYWLLEYL